jgi:hypothetical protein
MELNMKNKILFLVLVLSATISLTAHAGTVDLTTIYPAPEGEYQNLEASNSMCVGNACVVAGAPPLNPGELRASGTLNVAGGANVTGDTTINGTTRTSAMVIQQGTPANIQDGQIWIE